MTVVATPRERGRSELMGRVRARRDELEEAIFARVLEGNYVSSGDDDAEYVEGLRATIKAAVGYALVTLEPDEDFTPAPPPQAMAQARRAARLGVNLDTVMRRYVLGSTMLGDLLVQEVANSDLAEHPIVLREVLSTQATVLERLLAAITAEYNRELERTGASPAQRLVERVLALLAGAPGDLLDVGYELDGWHLGAIATGTGAVEGLRSVAKSLKCRLLHAPCGEQMAWVWLGSRDRPAIEEIERALAGLAPVAAFDGSQTMRSAGHVITIALGEPGWALEGWRLTHRQAQAAMRVALRAPQPLTRYADVALLAAVLRDDSLAESMVEVYLAPLGSRDGSGAVLRETLLAYYKADCNASSAASALAVSRHTIENRLRTIEEKLGHTLRRRQAELEVALRLEQLAHGARPDRRDAGSPSSAAKRLRASGRAPVAPVHGGSARVVS